VDWIFMPSVFPTRKIIFIYILMVHKQPNSSPQHCVDILRKHDSVIGTDLLKNDFIHWATLGYQLQWKMG
jgi:hypothetical protein